MPGAVIGAVASTVVGGLLSDDDDNGASAANEASADATALQARIAKDQWNRYKEIYEPLERGLVSEASLADSPEAYARAAGDASATVSSQFGKARDRMNRQYGFDPTSAAGQAATAELGMAQAASDATQQNIARQGVKDAAWAKKTGVLGMGKGLDSTAASSLGAASSSLRNQAQMGLDQAAGNAAMVGRVTDRIVGSPGAQSWFNGVGSRIANTVGAATGSGGAGSMNWGGSVQGNSDYVYDL